MVAGQDLVSIGEPVACKVGGVIQLVNEEGPTTQREFASLRIPAGPEVAGRVIDFLGREWAPGGAPGAPIESKVAVPLLNAAPPLDSRESICSGITTGVRAVDVIAPLGKGQR